MTNVLNLIYCAIAALVINTGYCSPNKSYNLTNYMVVFTLESVYDIFMVAQICGRQRHQLTQTEDFQRART